VLKRLVDLDHAALTLARCPQARSPHTEGVQILDVHDEDDGDNWGPVSGVRASQAEPDDTGAVPALCSDLGPLTAEGQQGSTAIPAFGGDIESVAPLRNYSYHPTITMNEQLEELCRPAMGAMSIANIGPLPAATWDMVRWENAREVHSSKIAAGAADPHSVDNDLQSFISMVEGTARGYQCMVPIHGSQGGPVYCGYQIQRKDRILRHVKGTHLNYRPFVCGGRCGSNAW
jgi:hypothetical protein